MEQEAEKNKLHFDKINSKKRLKKVFISGWLSTCKGAQIFSHIFASL
ncbi:hypothetical protein M153_7590003923 [Pseudoloma neurophilia]|uniref:Uncharacterized protein n=1 Tax=Pseudoloma neurophilia TaxID=146866 RepID=A0A0R0M084_9MICR|nr:hypothetical protein M153_7590003923 [Pseudoloma neurophilia]